VKQQQFKSSYLFGAVCPKKDKGCALVLPYANTEAMQLHLDEISKNVTKGYHAVVVMDGAGWHKSKELKLPKKISIIPLPPYSPELNPMEQGFEHMRKTKLSNTCYKDYRDIDIACADAWNEFNSKDGKIKKLCTRKWANIS